MSVCLCVCVCVCGWVGAWVYARVCCNHMPMVTCMHVFVCQFVAGDPPHWQ